MQNIPGQPRTITYKCEHLKNKASAFENIPHPAHVDFTTPSPLRQARAFFFGFVRVRRYVGRWSMACPAVRPHFFGACPKKRCRAAKEKRFFYLGGSTIRVSATGRWTISSSPDFGRGGWWVSGRVRVRRFLGWGSLPCPAIRPHFFCLAKRNGVEPPKKSAFEASTSPWWAHPPLPFGRKPQRDELVRQVDLCPVGKSARQSQLDAVGCDVGASSPWERRAGPNSSRGGTLKRVSLGLHPVSLRKSKEMGWNGQ